MLTTVAEFGEKKQRKGSTRKETEKRGEKNNREVYFVLFQRFCKCRYTGCPGGECARLREIVS